MQKRTLEAALQNASVDDPVVADRLAYFGPALLKVCEVARRLPTAELPEQARIEEALIRPDRTLLATAPSRSIRRNSKRSFENSPSCSTTPRTPKGVSPTR